MDANDLVDGFSTREVLFAQGQTDAFVYISAIPDAVFEPNEQMVVALGGTTLGTVNPAAVTPQILNDDAPPPVVALEASTFGSVPEGDGERDADSNPLPANTLSFGIVRTGDVSAASTVTFTLSDGGSGGLTADDIIGVSLVGGSSSSLTGSGLGPYTATFAAGVQDLSVTVSIQGDRVVEGNETLRVTLTGAGDATLSTTGPLVATGTITDDDTVQPPVFTLISFAGNDALVGEARSATFPIGVSVVRTGDLSQAATVVYRVERGLTGTSAAPEDLRDGFGDFTLSFASGSNLAVGLIYMTDDTLREPDETFRVSLVSSSVGTVSTNVNEFTIQDDDGSGPPPPGPGSLFFSGSSPDGGRQLWAFDPAWGTLPNGNPIARPVAGAETAPGGADGNPLEITRFGETVFWRGDSEFGQDWHAWTSVLGRQQLADLSEFAFDVGLAPKDRTLSVVSGNGIFVAAEDSGDVLKVFDRDGSPVGQVGLVGSYRGLLTGTGDGVAYAAAVETELDDQTGADVEQLFIVLPDANTSDGWTSVAATSSVSGLTDPSIGPNVDIREIAGFKTIENTPSGANLSYQHKMVFFAGDFVAADGSLVTDRLFLSTLHNARDSNGFSGGWASPIVEEVAVPGTGGNVPLAPRDLTVAKTGSGTSTREGLFFFGKADDGFGGSEGRIFAATANGTLGHLQPGSTSLAFASTTAAAGATTGLTIDQGFDIAAYTGGVAFSAYTDTGRAVVNNWTDVDGDGTFTLGSVFSGNGGVIEDLVTDAAGNIAFTWDQGGQESLYVWVWQPVGGFTPELREIVIRGGTLKEIDALRLEGGRLTYRMNSFAGDFPGLFVHDIASGSGREIGTDAFSAGTDYGAFGEPWLIATDSGVAFQADQGPLYGTRLFTAAEGTHGYPGGGFVVSSAADGAPGTGIAFDGDWIGTGYSLDTALGGLYRVNGDATVSTLYTASTNFGGAVAGLGRKILFGETTDVENDVLVHDLSTGGTSTLLENHVIGSAATVGSQIIFSALDNSITNNGGFTTEDDIWSLYSYDGVGQARLLTYLPGAFLPVGDDPIVPFRANGGTFFGDDDRIFWKQQNDAGLGVEIHTLDPNAANPAATLTVYDIAPGTDSNSVPIWGVAFNEALFVNDRFYFLGSSNGTVGEMRLMTTDGNGVPKEVTGPDLRAPFGFPDDLVAVGGEVFFSALDVNTGSSRVFQVDDDGATATPLALPGIDGPVTDLARLGNDVGVIAFMNGIEQVFQFTPGAQPGLETAPVKLTSFTTNALTDGLTLGGDGRVYFTRAEPATGRELWVLDQMEFIGAELVVDANQTPAPVGYRPEHVADVFV